MPVFGADGIENDGMSTLGAEKDGISTLGAENDGMSNFGVENDGRSTLGAEKDGIDIRCLKFWSFELRNLYFRRSWS